ncbi:MAG: mechanosensitive ion channel [Proteobacteria bacterium]|nr:mechanosensitive ion channel [Pseudomonadota bacterium]MDA0914373.1 mechanosensitive ion channel [Pseudomonadota bacterium]MDA1032675.1 mechanosensitive ion channel [Pseudomonadota bacterium]
MAYDIAVSALIVAVAVVIAYLIYRAVFRLVSRVTRVSETNVDDEIIGRIRAPIKWSFIAIAVTLAAQYDASLGLLWEPLAQFLRPALLGWIAYNAVKGFTAAIEARIEISDDPVAMRSQRTRLAVLSRILTFGIIVITVGLMLFTIPSVRTIGTTMLASAGLAALAIGAAAQPALKSLIAGLQIALTEPLRLGDLVKVDGELGRVEEIRMSFITVRTWDERVIIVPTSRFLDASFENWSRENEKLSGPVMLHLDPIANVAPIRAEFERFVRAHELYDGRNMALLMTEAYPESVELRLAVSSSTIGKLWQLRCDLREHMLKWLRENQPDALIRHRLEVPNGHSKAGEP